jgi:hypothetical protein
LLETVLLPGAREAGLRLPTLGERVGELRLLVRQRLLGGLIDEYERAA